MTANRRSRSSRSSGSGDHRNNVGNGGGSLGGGELHVGEQSDAAGMSSVGFTQPIQNIAELQKAFALVSFVEPMVVNVRFTGTPMVLVTETISPTPVASRPGSGQSGSKTGSQVNGTSMVNSRNITRNAAQERIHGTCQRIHCRLCKSNTSGTRNQLRSISRD